MGLIVQKYGGTSVGDTARLMQVARKIKATHHAGHQVVVVVSAMGNETDRLEELAYQITNRPSSREMDVLLATGEQVSIALLCMALHELGCCAKSYMGSQVAIHTNSAYTKARIEWIDESKILADLAQGIVVVVAGFQGVDTHGDVTTLGRGGSDTTAVALAAALKADECQIYTDVEGVYTTDPRCVPQAQRMPRVTFEEMLELSSSGAQVLQNRAVELAGKYQVPLRVLSTFKEGPGTLITLERGMEQPLVSGIAFNRDEAKLAICALVNKPSLVGDILGPISQANIEVGMITQHQKEDGSIDFIFTVHKRDYERAFTLLQQMCKEAVQQITGNINIAKISLVGVGLRSHPAIVSTVFSVLGAQGINIQLISSCEIKVSVIVDEKYLELGVSALHEAFNLHQPLGEEKPECLLKRA